MNFYTFSVRFQIFIVFVHLKYDGPFFKRYKIRIVYRFFFKPIKSIGVTLLHEYYFNQLSFLF